MSLTATPHGQRKYLPLILATVYILGAVLLALPMGTRAEGQVHLFYFYDPNCSVCAEVHRDVLEPLLKEYGERVAVEECSIAEQANFELLLDLEQQYQVISGSIPEVVIGQDILAGADQIRGKLRERIEHYLAQGGVELPIVAKVTVTPAPTAATVHIAFFFQPGCDECERSEHDLKYIQDKYPQVQIRRLNVKDEAALNQYLCKKAGVPDAKHLTAPALFVADKFLLGDEVRSRPIEALIAPYLSVGAQEPWAGWEAGKTTAEQAVIERFRSFGLLTIVGAGLIDGINPCAFATLIFLLSYLSAFERKGRDLLATGAAFTLGVFLTYLGVGFGFLRFLASLSILNLVGKWIYGLTLVLCLALAWGSLTDYRKARQGRLQDMSLRLPDRLRGWAKALIRKGVGMRRFVLGSFALGFGVSLVELACTGQVYLPTIIFVLGIPQWRTQASLALLIYNLVFIVPLVGVFLLVYWGTTSQQLTAWLTQRTAAIKLGTAVLFLLLAAWLGYSILTI